jgi:dTDP-4-dehydrorhamnose 3,5-epimerase
VIFKETPLPGAYVIELEKREDDRGFFARAWCQNEFEEHGLNTRLVQCNLSYNHKSGTLRGMHFQAPPKSEVKLIRCTRGAVWDVIVDLRRNSWTYKHSYGEELTSDNRKMMYVPEEFAHGYITLVPDTETFYQVTEFYSPDHERGIRWNDPAIGIEWPDIEVSVVSEKDAAFPDFKG